MLVSTMGATSGAPEFTPGFQWDSCYSIFCFIYMCCRSVFVLLCCLIFFDSDSDSDSDSWFWFWFWFWFGFWFLILILILDSDSDSWFWFLILILILILNTFFCIFKLFLFQQCSCSLTQYTYIVVKYEIILHSLRNMLRDFHQRLAFIPVSKPSTKWFFLFSDNVRILYE